MPPMIHPRCLCTTAVIAEKLYVCGGECRRDHITLERFHPAQEKWELPRPTLHRRGHTTMAVAVLRDDCMLLAAGAMAASLWMQSRAMTPRQTLGKNPLLC